MREMLADACVHLALGEPVRRPAFKALLINNR
jgi:hypothetical protein